MSEVIVAGGQGQAFAIESGQRFRVIDLEGKQVGDLVVFLGGDRTERLSPGNTRKLNGSLLLGVGSTLYSTKCPSARGGEGVGCPLCSQSFSSRP